MSHLPFQTYDEASKHFGIPIPRAFFNNLITIDKHCQANGYDTPETLFELFGVLRIEGDEARYQQTPVELFPFGSTGSDGIHYGFIIHTADEDDYPSGEICPMDSDGVVVIGNNTHDLFQNLLTDEESIDKFRPLLKELRLNATVMERERYNDDETPVRIKIKPRKDWKFVDTTDGAGVFAEAKFFDDYHEAGYDTINPHKTVERFEELVNKMYHRGLYASQLYYLKELFWNEWTNYALAKKYLGQMLVPYEKLGRQHLYETTKRIIGVFDKEYPG